MTLIDSLISSRSDLYSGDFALSDQNACDHCSKRQTCDRNVMYLHSDIPVAVIDMDEWRASRSDDIPEGTKICDFMLHDAEEQYASRKVAFCDLTCSQQKYTEPGGSTKYPLGKRDYAIKQMLSTINLFFNRPVIDQQIMTATDRKIIFGVRLSDETSDNAAAKSMSAFMQTPSSMAGVKQSKQNVNGISFDYIEVKYPKRLQW